MKLFEVKMIWWIQFSNWQYSLNFGNSNIYSVQVQNASKDVFAWYILLNVEVFQPTWSATTFAASFTPSRRFVLVTLWVTLNGWEAKTDPPRGWISCGDPIPKLTVKFSIPWNRCPEIWWLLGHVWMVSSAQNRSIKILKRLFRFDCASCW